MARTSPARMTKGRSAIITEDPTCDAWNRIADGLSAQERNVDWVDRDKAIPAASWTPQQRTTYETVAKAMRTASDQTVGLATATLHRVMRELYVQFIAYARAFDEKSKTYDANDRHLPEVVDGIAASLVNICAAITYGVCCKHKRHWSPPWRLHRSLPPSMILLIRPDSLMRAIRFALTGLRSLKSSIGIRQTGELYVTDIPADQWTPEQKALNDAVVPIMNKFADDLERLGRSSRNPVLEDFAVLSAQYRRAYVLALPYLHFCRQLPRERFYQSGEVGVLSLRSGG